MKLLLALVQLIVLAGPPKPLPPVPVGPVASLPYYQMPAPGFGYTETAGAVNCYVDNTHGSATDTANPVGTSGTPRLTVPVAQAAGTVCQVTGGPYSFSGDVTWTSSGTLESPVFIKGVGFPVFSGNGTGHTLNLAGTYMIIEGLAFGGIRVDGEGVAIGIRGNSIGGTTSVGCVAIFGAGIVVSGNQIAACGNWTSETENDYHCVYMAPSSSTNWVLGNTIYHCGGDGVQVGDVSTAAENNFIGGNTIRQNRENAVDVKVNENTIISQNLMWGYDPRDSSGGEAVVVHDDGTSVWVINNFIYASNYGIVCSGATGMFVLGNIVSGTINAVPDSDPFQEAGILVYNTNGAYVLYNTVWLWDNGISMPSGLIGTNASVGNLVAAVQTFNPGSSTISTANNLYNTDPSFVNYAALNFRLLPESVAKDAGGTKTAIHDLYETTFSVTLDLDIYNQTRAGNYSIGASES